MAFQERLATELFEEWFFLTALLAETLIRRCLLWAQSRRQVLEYFCERPSLAASLRRSGR